MIKKVSIFFISLLLCIIIILPNTVLTIAGDEDNPEIEDAVRDVPFGFIDIVSAWFYEDAKEPEYLYIAIKVRNLQYRSIMTIYYLGWRSNRTDYVSYFSTSGRGKYCMCFAGQMEYTNPIFGSCDLENNIIAMKIPKREIGDPKEGDTLRNPLAMCMYSSFAAILMNLNIYSFIDYAPNNGYGDDYVIQF
jgi:hypothetical protein